MSKKTVLSLGSVGEKLMGQLILGLVLGVAFLAAQEACAWSWPSCQNTSGGSPEAPAAVYLGDTGLTFGCDSWGMLDTKWGKPRLAIKTSNDVHNGTYGSWASYTDQNHKSVTSPQFTSSGTWYWGIQVEYTDAGGTTGWYCQNWTSWQSMYGTPTSVLTVNVLALNNPSISTVARNSSNPSSSIDITCSKNAQSHNVMIVRKASSVSSWTEPTQNTSYTAGGTIADGIVVVYNGALATTPATVTDTGLNAATTYDYKAYSVNNNYYSAGVVGSSATTLATAPTSNPTVGTFTSVGATSMTVNWSGGDGTYAVVVMKATSAPSGDPQNGTTYSASTTLSSGQSLGGGNVVFSGSGTSVAVTGLTPGQTYYVKVYAFNGSGGTENYYVTTPGSGGASTQVAPPTSNPTVGAFTSVGATGMTVNWSGGDGAYAIVVMKDGSAPSGDPVNGTTYSASTTLSSGQSLGGGNVVFSGSGTSVAVTGLTAGHTYYVKVYAFNGSGGTENYYVTTPGSGNQITLATAPTSNPTVGTFTSIGTTGMTVNWSGGDGTYAVVVMKATSAPSGDPQNGTTYSASTTLSSGQSLGGGNVVFSGSGSTVTVIGLAVNQAYYVKVYAFNGSGGTENYYVTSPGSGNQSTLDAPSIILSSPASITVTSMVGTAIGSQAFVVTNGGGSSLSYTLATNAAATWLSLSAASGGPLTANAGAAYTATMSAAGQGAGTQNGTITITSTGAGQNLATNNPQTIAVSLTLTNIPDVASQTATADGKELVCLSWVKAGYDVMVVYTNSSPPTQGQSYSVNGACGGGTVIYKGSGTGCEHVVLPGTVNNYTFYSMNGNYYSTGVTASATTDSYGVNPTEIVEPFAYTNGSSLSGKGGGDGFTGNWTIGAGTWTAETNYGTASIPSLASFTGYPANTGNRMKLSNPGSAGHGQADRSFGAVTSGKIYASCIMSYAWSGINKWAGMSFLSNGVEKAFSGKISDAVKWYAFGLSGYSGTTVSSPEYGIKSYGNESETTNNVWLMVMMYDVNSGELKGKCYYRTDTVPSAEPSTWDASTVLSGGAMIRSIDGIRVQAGSSDSGQIGDTYFDEIRVAKSWAGLLNLLATKPTTSPSNVTFPVVNTTSMTVNWDNGNGASNLVVMKDGGAPTSVPVEGMTYTANAAYGTGGTALGDGYVVYKGGGTSVAVTGLTVGHTYSVAVYALNGSAGTENYLTTSPGTGSQATQNLPPSILRTPASITVTSMVGTAVSGQSFTVTNGGGGTLSYALTTNAAWLSVSPVTGSGLTANQGLGHIATLSVAGLSAATYNGAITITDSGSSQTPDNNGQTIPVSLTLTNIPSVSLASAAADGKEMVRLTWTGAGHDVMVVYTNSTPPTPGQSYSVNGSCGGGTVIYKGSGTSLEHVVLPGTVNNYSFYSVNNSSNYSSGVTASATTGSYGVNPTEIVEPFAYTNGALLAGQNGGNGFSGPWAVSNGTLTVNEESLASWAYSGYPSNSANKVVGDASTEFKVFRTLSSEVTNGSLYVSYIMHYSTPGTSKYAGLSFMNGATEGGFFGKVSSADKRLGVSHLATDATGNPGYNLEATLGEDYLIIGKYDFTAGTLSVKAYSYLGQQHLLNATEIANWDATMTGVTIDKITGIRLAASGTGSTYFDEVRLSTTWAGLINLEVATPVSASATASGQELVRLSWTKSGLMDVMIVASTNGAVLSAPESGHDYVVGNECGGGTVIYQGGGSSLEQVLSPGSTVTYRFYSNNGQNPVAYSAALSSTVTMLSYGVGERVEPFAYTNGAVLNGLNGGHGWVGGWTDSSNAYTVSEGSFAPVAGYAANYGNKIIVNPPAGANEHAFRSFNTVNSGKIYVSFLMNYLNSGGYAGVSFINSTTEEAFFGKVSSAAGNLGLSDGHTDKVSTYMLTPGVGHDYVIIGMYDFSTSNLTVKAYSTTNTLPLTEPGSWDVTNNLSVAIPQITGIRLGAGGGVGVTPGNTYFDEIRVATNWVDIVNTPAPTTQASSIQFGNVQAYQMDVLWTRGNGTGCIVVASDTILSPATPPDRVNYTASAVYSNGTAVGNGFIVYKGVGTSVTVSGLSMDTMYYFKVFEFNGASDAVRLNAMDASSSQKTILVRGTVFSIR